MVEELGLLAARIGLRIVEAMVNGRDDEETRAFLVRWLSKAERNRLRLAVVRERAQRRARRA